MSETAFQSKDNLQNYFFLKEWNILLNGMMI